MSEAIEPPRRSISLRGRVALLVAAAVAVAVAVLSLAVYLGIRSQLSDDFDNALLARAQAAVQGALADPRLLASVPADALGDVRVAVVTSSGSAVVASGGTAPPLGPVELAVARRQLAQSVRSVSDGSGTMTVVAVPAGQGTALVLAESTQATADTLRTLRLTLLLVGLLGVAAAAAVGLIVARAGLRPVEQLTAAAEEIARTERLDPIAVHGTDELARLTTAFNSMLVALDTSRTRQRQLVADAGHELRTPLTSLRTNVELLVQSDASQPEARLSASDREALMADVRAQIEELGALVGDLVELSRDEETGVAERVPVDLAETVDRATERARRRAPQLRFDVRLEPWEVVGDQAGLERAVMNLLDNAAKWSPSGGTVTVRLTSGVLTVSDEGPGIAAADLPHVFERFYRSSAARAMPGSGLGLAIVAQTVARHGGAVSAGPVDPDDARPGTRLTLQLPGAPVS